MDTIKLVNFVPQDLKSLSNYLEVEYLNKNVIAVLADFPGQYYICKAITLKRLYGNNIDIHNQILHLVLFLGSLHNPTKIAIQPM
ncbi:19776_t:CDS:2 [Entrophospora sp. SA101]|nr:19776_t:CDS:2 [Entrophospora sp. SA101]